MDQTEIHIKRNIEAAREAMNEKIELLETRIHKAVVVPKLATDEMIENIDQVKAGMEEIRSSIDHGLDTINHTVEETIIRIKSTADCIVQVEHDPWIMFGSAILMGYAIGSLNRGTLVARRHACVQAEESY